MKTQISKEAYNALQNTPVKTEILYFLVQDDVLVPEFPPSTRAETRAIPGKYKRAKLTRTRLPSDQLKLKDGWNKKTAKLSILESHILGVMMPWLEEYATDNKYVTRHHWL